MNTTTRSAPAPSTRSEPPKIIDPKFRARRVAVKRQQGRRRLRVLLASVAVFTTAGLLFLATQSSLLDVDAIEVVGSEHTPAPIVAQVTGITRGAPLVWVRRAAAARRVERLPWVRDARIDLVLPGKVRIRVVERIGIAAVARGDGSFAVIDRNGRVLTLEATRAAGQPEIVGTGSPRAPGATLPAARPALDALAALPADLRNAVVSVDVTDGGLTVHFAAGPEARLGNAADLGAKVAALHAVLGALQGRPAGYVDVRVPNAPVVG